MQIFSDFRNLPGYWLWALGVLAVGLLMNFHRSDHWTYHSAEPVLNFWEQWIDTLAKEVLTVGYVLVLNGLYQQRKQPVTLINTVGRMALSVYILQTLMGVFFFYGYGLGYFNQLSRLELVAFVICSWLIQLTLVWLYARSNNQGPLEKLWRKLTYRAVP